MKRLYLLIACFPLLCFGQQRSALSDYNLSAKKPQQFVLPKKLSEASGLAFTSDGRLFSHGDERGVVYQIDYSNGTIIKQFSLGKFGVNEDFEDIAIVGKRFFVVASNGVIFEFAEGENGERVQFKKYETFLSAKNDVEGLVYDPTTNALLLACKGSPGKGYNDFKAIYSFSLKSKELQKKPRFLISMTEVTKESVGAEFKPSGIALHPKTKTFFIIAAHGESIIELSSEGKLLGQQTIHPKANPHPEGIAFAPDLTLVLCNDGQGKNGSISLYPTQK
jgi:uncharacterized protein YjiK